MKTKQGVSLTKNAILLGAGTFIAKLLGAIYRVPLTNIIGSYGIGLYQMVFPLYCVLLDFSGAGVPNALSKLISSIDDENKERLSRAYLFTSVRFFLIIGVISGVLVLFFSNLISKLQGDINASLGYVFLSPAIVLSGIISCFRGYFQGHQIMYPTAVSQVVEQIIKLVCGVALCSLLYTNVCYAVAGATFSITISEAIALIFLLFLFRKKRKSFNTSDNEVGNGKFYGLKSIVKLTVPITLIGLVIPMSQVIDSFVIVNSLSKYTSDATALYGLFSGIVLTIIHLPVSICYGISVSVIPSISGIDELEKKKRARKSLFITLIFSVFASSFLFFFAPVVLKILFSRLSLNDFDVCVKLIKITSISIVFHSLLQTVNGILIGYGKTYSVVVGMVIAVIIKTILNLLLIPNVKFGIYGAGISLNACFFFAFLINFTLTKVKGKKHASKRCCARLQRN